MKALVEISPLPVDNVYISVYNSCFSYEYLSRLQKSYQQAIRSEKGKKLPCLTKRYEKQCRLPWNHGKSLTLCCLWAII